MKFIDVLRISLHNIFNNKLRTLLVTLVLFILSTIIVVVTTIGVNSLTIIDNLISGDSTQVADINFAYRIQNNSMGGMSENKYFSKEDISNYKKLINEDYPYMSAMTAKMEGTGHMKLDNVNNNSNISVIMTDMSTNMLSGTYNYLLDGRLWNKSDIGKSHIWIDQSIAESNGLEVGDTVDLTISIYSENFQDNNRKNCNMTIMGIIQYTKDIWSSYAICDYEFAIDNGAKINQIQFKQSDLGEEMNFVRLIELNGLVKKYNTYDFVKNPTGLEVISWSANDFFIMFYTTLGIIGFVILVSVIIILLSIGCVSNSIQITVEQNAKFFGMMKAIGMRNNTVKSIVRVQAIISIFIAVILATVVTIGILAGVEPLLGSLFASLGGDIVIKLSMPFYIPIVVFVSLVGMVMLFTIKSLNRISKMDVVSVISEVS